MNAVEKHLRQVNEGMTLLNGEEVQTVIRSLMLIKAEGRTVYLVGNGGSAATASHFANDLMKQAKIKAVCLNDQVPVMTAYGNDHGWENMYANPLRMFKLDGYDGVFGISCSGKSENVIRALGVGKERSAITMGMTGMSDSSEINQAVQFGLVHARVPDIRVQEDLHMMVCHAIVRTIQEEGHA